MSTFPKINHPPGRALSRYQVWSNQLVSSSGWVKSSNASPNASVAPTGAIEYGLLLLAPGYQTGGLEAGLVTSPVAAPVVGCLDK
jgi:hypothetical protein